MAYGVAEDNLRLSLSVIADCVNDCMQERNAWRDLGFRGKRLGPLEVEFDLRSISAAWKPGRATCLVLTLPNWQAVIGRQYEAWDRDRLIIDAAGRGVDACVAIILVVL